MEKVPQQDQPVPFWSIEADTSSVGLSAVLREHIRICKRVQIYRRAIDSIESVCVLEVGCLVLVCSAPNPKEPERAPDAMAYAVRDLLNI